MNTIIEFQNKEQFYLYLRKKVVISDVLGFGFEGKCYKSSKDQYAYKVLIDESYMCTSYDVDKIITTNDIKLKSFAFPILLFVLENELIGYTSKLVSNNLFSSNMTCDIENISKINFDKLIKAYYSMIKDTEKLSNEHILIDDLTFNLLFDGTSLTGIDTCGYTRKDYSVLNENLESLRYAIFNIFQLWTDVYLEKDTLKKLDIEEYLKDIKEEYTQKRKIITYR